MKKGILLAVIVLYACIATAKVYDLRDLGADAEGKEACTELINQTIQKAAAEGGGTLYFPAGTYLTAAIHMESNITLDIDAGATLLFSDHFEDYLPFVRMRYEGIFMQSFSPLIYARDCENIAVKGEGKINGQGHAWWKESRRIYSEINEFGDVVEVNELQQKWEDENDFEIGEYYNKALKTRFFRPPFIQFVECKNIQIEGITIVNSPFWTINPEGCDDIIVHGVTILNPSSDPKGPNTDGINPSSCRNVRISDCFISVGDDCITLKSGRDKLGRDYGRPNENITITNCVMLTGHGGVVIGSEMSGGVKNVTIANCVFDGTDNGIRLKSARGRGGVVESIRVNNIVMRDIQRDAFVFNLFYDKNATPEEVSERTPIFRNIHISNITGTDVNRVGYIRGIQEMPVSELSFTNINMKAQGGFTVHTAENLQFQNVDIAVEEGPSFSFTNTNSVVLNNIRSGAPLNDQAVLEIKGSENMLVTNCFPIVSTDVFIQSEGSDITWGNNYWNNVEQEVE